MAEYTREQVAVAQEQPAHVKCQECNGTGSSKPDCWMCHGQRTVTLKKAYRHGYRKADLPGLEDDDYCDCPACYEEASTCMFCYGDGDIDPFVQEQQKNRVLMAALGRFIPPVFYTDYRGQFVVDDDIDLLSREAAAQCREDGLIHWFCSIFGDEISLTIKGDEAAKTAWREYRQLCRRWVAAERSRRSQLQSLREDVKP